MLLAGVAVAIVLWKLALAVGASDVLMQYLYFPIGIAAVFACGMSGKYGVKLVQKLL